MFIVAENDKGLNQESTFWSYERESKGVDSVTVVKTQAPTFSGVCWCHVFVFGYSGMTCTFPAH